MANYRGTDGDDVLSLNNSGDVLFGLGGNDTLSSHGNNNKLAGGLGNDTYESVTFGTTIIEKIGEGYDVVIYIGTASYVLPANVEEGRLYGGGSLRGNALDNVLIGTTGDRDYLDGGTGADVMRGDLFGDTYVVDNIGDKVIEVAETGAERDTVFSTISYTLGNYVEDLELKGRAAINGTGNALGNRLTGNAMANTLSGLGGNDVLSGGRGIDTLLGGRGDDVLDGGAGADILSGGAGNDHYIVDSARDTITESGAGVDGVRSSVSYTLAANVEGLVAAFAFYSSAPINLTGNRSDNFILGNEGINVLKGEAGADWLVGLAGNDTFDGGNGNDSLLGQGTMTGGAGADHFYLATAREGVAEPIRITDFASGVDMIVLNSDKLAGNTYQGASDPAAFWQGTAAHDADDRLIYDSTTGELFFDADGNGALAQELLGTLAPGTTLVAADITWQTDFNINNTISNFLTLYMF